MVRIWTCGGRDGIRTHKPYEGHGFPSHSVKPISVPYPSFDTLPYTFILRNAFMRSSTGG